MALTAPIRPSNLAGANTLHLRPPGGVSDRLANGRLPSDRHGGPHRRDADHAHHPDHWHRAIVTMDLRYLPPSEASQHVARHRRRAWFWTPAALGAGEAPLRLTLHASRVWSRSAPNSVANAGRPWVCGDHACSESSVPELGGIGPDAEHLGAREGKNRGPSPPNGVIPAQIRDGQARHPQDPPPSSGRKSGHPSTTDAPARSDPGRGVSVRGGHDKCPTHRYDSQPSRIIRNIKGRRHLPPGSTPARCVRRKRRDRRTKIS